MDIRLLGLAGTVGTAVVGGGIYGAVKGSQQSISHLISFEKGLLLITKTTDEKGNDAGKKYKTANNGENKGNIKDGNSKKALEEAPTEFKEECERRAEVKVSDKGQQEYQDVKSGCTRPKKISELLSSEGKKTLLNRDGDTEEWRVIGTAYRKYHENSPHSSSVTYKDTDELGMTNGSEKRAQESVSEEYKTACQAKSESYIDETKITEDPIFQKVEKGCTKDKSRS